MKQVCAMLGLVLHVHGELEEGKSKPPDAFDINLKFMGALCKAHGVVVEMMISTAIRKYKTN